MIDRVSTAFPPAELRVRLAADPVCVSGARRFVTDGLRSWRRPELLDDAELCVSELAGNAVLHSGTTFMEIVLQTLHRGVRISVEDDGPTPAAAVQPRRRSRSTTTPTSTTSPRRAAGWRSCRSSPARGASS